MKIAKFLLSLIILLLIHVNAQATLVKTLNLSELTNSASVVIKAKVTAKDLVDDTEESHMMVNYYTLQVLETLKGEPMTEYVYKQVANGSYHNSNGVSIRQNFSFPELEVGKTYVLFLSQPATAATMEALNPNQSASQNFHETGLAAPIGLQQGIFKVEEVDGVDTIPQLAKRAAMLGVRSSGSTQSQTLTRMLTAVHTGATANTYQNFKSLIQAAGAQ